MMVSTVVATTFKAQIPIFVVSQAWLYVAMIIQQFLRELTTFSIFCVTSQNTVKFHFQGPKPKAKYQNGR